MINRQERCLRRLEKKLNRYMNANSEPTWVINTNFMAVIIQEIKKTPIAEAESLIRENISNLSVRVTLPEETSLSSRIGIPQPLPRPRSVSGSLDRSLYLSETEIARQAGPVVLKKKERETRAVFHDYGDGNRETYEVDSSASYRSTKQSDASALSIYGYVPVPPFNLSDLKLRKRRKHGD
jgi:hypothetical protein